MRTITIQNKNSKNNDFASMADAHDTAINYQIIHKYLDTKTFIWHEIIIIPSNLNLLVYPIDNYLTDRLIESQNGCEHTHLLLLKLLSCKLLGWKFSRSQTENFTVEVRLQPPMRENYRKNNSVAKHRDNEKTPRNQKNKKTHIFDWSI